MSGREAGDTDELVEDFVGVEALLAVGSVRATVDGAAAVAIVVGGK